MSKKKDPIVQTGAPVLRATAKPVAKKDLGSRKLKNLVAKMSKTLAKEGFGVALAAPQVGESLRLFIIAGKVFAQQQTARSKGLAEQSEETRGLLQEQSAVEPDPSRQGEAEADRVFINPEFIRKSKAKKEMTEGCLSVRHKYGSVVRHEKASIKALDVSGKPITYHGSGLVAQIFQHEVDHLDGILYTDKTVTLQDDAEWKELKDKRAKK